MLRKHVIRFSMLVALALVGTTPAFAAECTAYCQGYADGFCGASGQSAHYQGCSGSSGSYNCFFGCVPPY